MSLNMSDQIHSNCVIFSKGLNIGYKNEVVVEGVQIQLQKGQSLALVGTNGSGKSTLLKTLVGLLAPLSGTLIVLGEKPGRMPRQISYLSQFHPTGYILPLRVIDAVRMGRYANHGLLGKMTYDDDFLILQSLKRVGLQEMQNKSLSSLSGGQQKRAYIAQALTRCADVLFWDEPTAGLDAAGKIIYQQIVQEELARGASLVVATHDLQEAMNCDQAILLSKKVVAMGKGREVITSRSWMETFGVNIP
jgi:ABC-type Mn2+/Zn2+ transport system ATPase subunit